MAHGVGGQAMGDRDRRDARSVRRGNLRLGLLLLALALAFFAASILTQMWR